jgi:hypothetical protein
VGVSGNALATGALSGAYDRYQARIAWLLPLGATALPPCTLARVWDAMLAQASWKPLLRVFVALLGARRDHDDRQVAGARVGAQPPGEVDAARPGQHPVLRPDEGPGRLPSRPVLCHSAHP